MNNAIGEPSGGDSPPTPNNTPSSFAYDLNGQPYADTLES